MSKNLEREYRAYVNSEVPDLWARIEAGLEDKKNAPQESETDLHITDFPAADSQTENRRDKKGNVRVWGGLAACACLVLIIPAMTSVMKMAGGSSLSNSSSSTPQAAEQSWDKAEDIKQEAAYEAADNAAAADENGMRTSTTASNNTAADSGTDTINAVSGGLEETTEEEQESYSFQATVEILDVDAVHKSSEILYTAKVILSENADMQVNSEIKILSTAVAATLEKSHTYDVMLCERHSEDSDQDRIYVLTDGESAP